MDARGIVREALAHRATFIEITRLTWTLIDGQARLQRCLRVTTGWLLAESPAHKSPWALIADPPAPGRPPASAFSGFVQYARAGLHREARLPGHPNVASHALRACRGGAPPAVSGPTSTARAR
ncbi:MAG: hypothetical protein HS113_19825 [Verrucomicrobiales bacterium]|nr:hypothetical protein [Verrucomicrobiales bacterium]